MADKTEQQIEKMIAGAQAMGAPLFQMDHMLKGLRAVNAKISAIYKTDPSGLEMLNHQDIMADKEALKAGAEAAFFVATHVWCPNKIADFRDDEDITKMRTTAIDVAIRYVGKVGEK